MCWILCIVGLTDGDALSRLSPVLEQLDILEIQQTAIRQLTTEQENAAAIATASASEAATPSADADESETEAEQEESPDTAPELPANGDNKKTKVTYFLIYIVIIISSTCFPWEPPNIIPNQFFLELSI